MRYLRSVMRRQTDLRKLMRCLAKDPAAYRFERKKDTDQGRPPAIIRADCLRLKDDQDASFSLSLCTGKAKSCSPTLLLSFSLLQPARHCYTVPVAALSLCSYSRQLAVLFLPSPLFNTSWAFLYTRLIALEQALPFLSTRALLTFTYTIARNAPSRCIHRLAGNYSLRSRRGRSARDQRALSDAGG